MLIRFLHCIMNKRTVKWRLLAPAIEIRARILQTRQTDGKNLNLSKLARSSAVRELHTTSYLQHEYTLRLSRVSGFLDRLEFLTTVDTLDNFCSLRAIKCLVCLAGQCGDLKLWYIQ